MQHARLRQSPRCKRCTGLLDYSIRPLHPRTTALLQSQMTRDASAARHDLGPRSLVDDLLLDYSVRPLHYYTTLLHYCTTALPQSQTTRPGGRRDASRRNVDLRRLLYNKNKIRYLLYNTIRPPEAVAATQVLHGTTRLLN